MHRRVEKTKSQIAPERSASRTSRPKITPGLRWDQLKGKYNWHKIRRREEIEIIAKRKRDRNGK
jgi:hypothetical protein